MNWRSVSRKNNTPNEISSGFNAVDMFSMYVWHVHNVETLLKLVLGIWGRYLQMFFEIIISVQWIWCGTTIHVRVLGEVINMTRRGGSQPNQLIAEVYVCTQWGEQEKITESNQYNICISFMWHNCGLFVIKRLMYKQTKLRYGVKLETTSSISIWYV